MIVTWANCFGSSGRTGNPQLPLWAAALAAQLAGTRRAKLMWVGDSTSMGAWGNNTDAFTSNRQYAMANFIATKLIASGYGGNVGNWWGDSNSTVAGTTLIYDPRITMGVGWAFATGLFVLGGNWCRNLSNANKLSLVPVANFDTIEVFYIQNATGGPFDIAVDGGAKIGATVATSGANAIIKVTRTTTLGPHTVDIFKDNSGDGLFANIIGINTFDSTALKVDCYNTGFAGAGSADWASVAQPYRPGPSIATIAPDLTIIDLTINDTSNTTPIATYQANLQYVVTQAKLSGDAIMVTGNPTLTLQATQPTYNAAAQQVAIANNMRFVDVFANWGSYAAANAQGWYPVGETTHPNATGYQAIADFLYPSILP